MPKNTCYGIYDTETGLWLIGYNPAAEYNTWGNEVNAVCFPTEAARDAALAEMGGTGRFIGQNPRPR